MGLAPAAVVFALLMAGGAAFAAVFDGTDGKDSLTATLRGFGGHRGSVRGFIP